MTDVRPPVSIVSPRGRLVILAVFCAVVAAMGVVVIAVGPDQVLNIVVGVGAIGFFGIGGGFSIARMWVRSTILRATDAGIRIAAVGVVPWSDIDRIGSTSLLLGIRLRRYDAVASVPRTEHTAEAMRATRASSGGWDLTWPKSQLDRTPAQAASALNARRP
ncbi:hypothetical protein ABCS02_25605 [Microbacterium sp. X-17]|uniref:hypothetical protein n=1 Tax=Microbacterium sp. X-17 TaxID=3144404 RepID=UPI0031F5717F